VRPKSEAEANHLHCFNYLNPQSHNLVAGTQLAMPRKCHGAAGAERSLCSFDAGMLCWMYRRGNHFSEDGKAADSAFRFSKSFSGKACPKLMT
jgi:hypothetical protein